MVESYKNTESWLVIKRSFRIPDSLSRHDNALTTDIAIAIPICTNTLLISIGEDDSNIIANSQDIFAFLPVRSYGLPFIVQADFELPSHRQDLKEDSEWNQWLLLHIPQLFVDTVPIALNKYLNNTLQASRMLLHFIPSLDRVSGLFVSTAREIVRLVSRLPLMLCSDGSLRPSSSTALADNRGLLLSGQILGECLGLYYIDPIVSRLVSLTVLQSLDVQTLDFNHILDAAQILGQDTLLVAQWLRCLAAILPSLNLSKETELIARLRHLPIIPIQGRDTLVKLSEFDGLIFVAPESQLEEKSAWKEMLYKSLLTVDLSVLLASSVNTQTDEMQIRVLLQRAGIRKMAPLEIYNEHVCHLFKTADKVSENLLIACLLFSWDIWKQDANLIDMDKLALIVSLKTNLGMLNPLTDVINFSRHYGNKYNLESDFPGYKWALVDICYLEMSKHSASLSIPDRMKWRTFLHKLGVVDLVSVRKHKQSLSTSEFLFHFGVSEQHFPANVSNVIVDDWICVQFEEIARNGAEHGNNLITLFKALEENWNSCYDMYKTAKVYTNEYDQILTLDSSFFKQLKSLQWLPCTDRKNEDSTVFCSAGDTYIDCPNMRQLLTHHVPYLRVQIDNQSLFSQDLGLVNSIDPHRMLSILIQWSTDKCQYDFSFSHMNNVYEFLWRSLDQQEIQSAFLQNNLIYSGQNKFVNRFSVHWTDPTGLFERYTEKAKQSIEGDMFSDIFQCTFLSPYYSDRIKDFFICFASVSDVPSINEYIRLLELIQALSELNRRNFTIEDSVGDVNHLELTDAYKIFEEIAIHCKNLINESEEYTNTMESIRQNIQDLLRGKNIFPSTHNNWVEASDFLILPDSRHLFDKFSISFQQIYNSDSNLGKPTFLAIPGRQLNSTSRCEGLLQDLSKNQQLFLVDLCGLIRLSDCAQKEIITESLKPIQIIQNSLSTLIPCLQRYMLQHFSLQYNILNEQLSPPIAYRLSKIRFFSVSKLELVYRLKQNPSLIVIISSNCCYQDMDDGSIHFYIQRSFIDNHREILKSFSDLFACGNIEVSRSLCNFFMLLRDEFGNLENFARYQGFSLTLQEDHPHVWSIQNIPVDLDTMDSQQIDTPDPEKVQSFMSLTQKASANRQNAAKKSQASKSNNDQTVSSSVSWPPTQNTNYQFASSEISGPLLSSPVQKESGGIGSKFNQFEQYKGQSESMNPSVFPAMQTQNLEEIDFEPLLKLQQPSTTTYQSVDNQSLGLWGERLVFDHLMARYRDEIESGNVSVQWINSSNETGAPYDLIVDFVSEHKQLFIEVKSTLDEERNTFPISLQQLKLALEKPQNFQIYRVYNAGNWERVKLRAIRDVLLKLENKAIQLWMNV